MFTLCPIGKGDLVGCDMNAHLQAHNGAGAGANTDVVVKSSCDVKVISAMYFIFLLVPFIRYSLDYNL